VASFAHIPELILGQSLPRVFGKSGMQNPREIEYVLKYFVEKLEEPVKWTVRNDYDSPVVGILLRQRMIDTMKQVDEEFSSVLYYQYDPFPEQTPNGIKLTFTDQEDVDSGPISIGDLSLWPWEDDEEENIVDWPTNIKPKLTDARPCARRVRTKKGSRPATVGRRVRTKKGRKR